MVPQAHVRVSSSVLPCYSCHLTAMLQRVHKFYTPVPQMLHDEASTRSLRDEGFHPGIVLESPSSYCTYPLISRARITFATSAPVTEGNFRCVVQLDFYFGSKPLYTPRFSATRVI